MSCPRREKSGENELKADGGIPCNCCEDVDNPICEGWLASGGPFAELDVAEGVRDPKAKSREPGGGLNWPGIGDFICALDILSIYCAIGTASDGDGLGKKREPFGDSRDGVDGCPEDDI